MVAPALQNNIPLVMWISNFHAFQPGSSNRILDTYSSYDLFLNIILLFYLHIAVFVVFLSDVLFFLTSTSSSFLSFIFCFSCFPLILIEATYKFN